MERDIGALKAYLTTLLEDLVKKRKENNIVPCAVAMTTIQRSLIDDAKKAINELCAESRVIFHRTINSVVFESAPSR